MGQAKRRGSREDRIQQALERKAAEADARQVIEEATRRQYEEWYAGLDDLDRAEEDARIRRRKSASMSVVSMVALAAALGGRHRW